MCKTVAIWVLLALLVLSPLAPASPALAEAERAAGYYTVVDSDTGQVIFRTGMEITAGDKYLTGNNLLYKIVSVKGLTGYADYLGRENLRASLPSAGTWFQRLTSSVAVFLHLKAPAPKAGPVAIYHTHSDESYVPTDGTFSKPGHGGVYQVGDAMAGRLAKNGAPVLHSRVSHDPHDGLAYERSRRTAIDLLRRNPAALIDLHRDAAPRQEYADQIDNQGVTKVQIVLGRSNPNFKANEAFAKQLKAAVDKKYPGFIKGIYYGDGKYNQDLSPRAILLEFGAQTNAKQSAERAAAIFAAASQNLITASGSSLPQTGGVVRSILYILGGVVVVGLLFLLLNAGSLSGAGRNLKRFFGQEFTSALGSKRRRKQGKDDDRKDRKP